MCESPAEVITHTCPPGPGHVHNYPAFSYCLLRDYRNTARDVFAHSLWENGPAIYPFSSWVWMYWSATTLCSCAEGVLLKLALHAGVS